MRNSVATDAAAKLGGGPAADRRSRGHAAKRVRPLGLKAPARIGTHAASPRVTPAGAPLHLPAPQGGMWSIPQVHGDIPIALSYDNNLACHLAQLSLYAHQHGMPIRPRPFVTAEAVLANQIEDYADAAFEAVGIGGLGSVVNCRLLVPMAPEAQAVLMFSHTGGSIPLARLKPSYERLEAIHAGLGNTLLQGLDAIRGLGVLVYDFEAIRFRASMAMFYGMDDDEAFLDEYNAQQNEDEQFTLEQLQVETSLMPSELYASGGAMAEHGGWFPRGMAKGEKAERSKRTNKSLSDRQVKALLQAHEGSIKTADANAVKAALALRAIEKRLKAKPSYGFEPDDISLDSETIGAVGFAVWDDSEITLDVIQHFEEYLQQGEFTEVYAAMRMDLNDTTVWPHLIERIKREIDVLAQSNALLQFLTDEEQDEQDNAINNTPNAPEGAQGKQR